MFKGYSYPATYNFEIGTATINDDNFVVKVFDSNDTLVAEYTTAPNVVKSDKQLTVLFDDAVTAELGTYTYFIIWNRVSTGENFPAIKGIVKVTNNMPQ